MDLRNKSWPAIIFIFFLTLFFILSFYFFKYPLGSHYLFIFYSALSLWAIIFLDLSSAKFFIFFSFLLGLSSLLFQWTGYTFVQGLRGKVFLTAELLIFWIVWWMITNFRQREEKEKIKQEKILQELEKNTEETDKELNNYVFQLKNLETKINRFQILSLATRELGSSLDSAKIQNKFKNLLATCFPESVGKVSLEPFEIMRDPFSKWIGERYLPLLITNLKEDLRFPETVSAGGINSFLAAPLMVENKILGIAKIEGREPYLYDNDDLRLLDLLTMFASLALENAHLFSKVQELSITDTLTGLYTHRFFQERLNEEILRAGRYHLDLGLLLIDIDHFKKFNDTYGHQVGDEILKMVAQFVKQRIRSSDFIARYGGEEFAVLLLQNSYQTSYLVAERMCQAIAENSFFVSQPGLPGQGMNTASKELKITVSIGVSAFPEETTTFSQLIRLADQRLYQAKTAGRNRAGGKI